MKERSKQRLRLALEIVGALAVIVSTYIAVSEYRHSRVQQMTDLQHAPILAAVDSETQARAAENARIWKAIEALAATTSEQSRTVGELSSTVKLMVGEMQIVLHRLNLNGGG